MEHAQPYILSNLKVCVCVYVRGGGGVIQQQNSKGENTKWYKYITYFRQFKTLRREGRGNPLIVKQYRMLME